MIGRVPCGADGSGDRRAITLSAARFLALAVVGVGHNAAFLARCLREETVRVIAWARRSSGTVCARLPGNARNSVVLLERPQAENRLLTKRIGDRARVGGIVVRDRVTLSPAAHAVRCAATVAVISPGGKTMSVFVSDACQCEPVDRARVLIQVRDRLGVGIGNALQGPEPRISAGGSGTHAGALDVAVVRDVAVGVGHRVDQAIGEVGEGDLTPEGVAHDGVVVVRIVGQRLLVAIAIGDRNQLALGVELERRVVAIFQEPARAIRADRKIDVMPGIGGRRHPATRRCVRNVPGRTGFIELDGISVRRHHVNPTGTTRRRGVGDDEAVIFAAPAIAEAGIDEALRRGEPRLRAENVKSVAVVVTLERQGILVSCPEVARSLENVSGDNIDRIANGVASTGQASAACTLIGNIVRRATVQGHNLTVGANVKCGGAPVGRTGAARGTLGADVKLRRATIAVVIHRLRKGDIAVTGIDPVNGIERRGVVVRAEIRAAGAGRPPIRLCRARDANQESHECEKQCERALRHRKAPSSSGARLGRCFADSRNLRKAPHVPSAICSSSGCKDNAMVGRSPLRNCCTDATNAERNLHRTNRRGDSRAD